MRYVLFIILAILTNNCGKENTNYQPSPDSELADRIYNREIGRKVFIQLEKNRNLHVCESGWGLRSKKKIPVMHCGFFYHEEIDIDQARELLLEAGNLYLATINENEKIRPFLENYPFAPENIEIRIFLHHRDGSKFPPEKICIASLEQGILRYRIRALDAKGYFTIIGEEKYEEAMEKFTAYSMRQSKEIPQRL